MLKSSQPSPAKMWLFSQFPCILTEYLSPSELSAMICASTDTAGVADAAWRMQCQHLSKRSPSSLLLPPPWQPSMRHMSTWVGELNLATAMQRWPYLHTPPPLLTTKPRLRISQGHRWHVASRMQQGVNAYFADIPHYLGEQARACLHQPQRERRFCSFGSEDEDELVSCFSALWGQTNQDKSLQRVRYLIGVGAAKACIAVLQYQCHEPFLRCGQNFYVPYYATAVLGSLLHGELTAAEVKLHFFDEGLLEVLLPLLRGSLSFEEQRLAVRCIQHAVATSGDSDADPALIEKVRKEKVAQWVLLHEQLGQQLVACLSLLIRTGSSTVICGAIAHPRRCPFHVPDLARKGGPVEARPRLFTDLRFIEMLSRAALCAMLDSALALPLNSSERRTAANRLLQPCVVAAIGQGVLDLCNGHRLECLEMVAKLASLSGNLLDRRFALPSTSSRKQLVDIPDNNKVTYRRALVAVAEPFLLSTTDDTLLFAANAVRLLAHPSLLVHDDDDAEGASGRGGGVGDNVPAEAHYSHLASPFSALPSLLSPLLEIDMRDSPQGLAARRYPQPRERLGDPSVTRDLMVPMGRAALEALGTLAGMSREEITKPQLDIEVFAATAESLKTKATAKTRSSGSGVGVGNDDDDDNNSSVDLVLSQELEAVLIAIREDRREATNNNLGLGSTTTTAAATAARQARVEARLVARKYFDEANQLLKKKENKEEANNLRAVVEKLELAIGLCPRHKSAGGDRATMLRRLAKVQTSLGEHGQALKSWARAWHREQHRTSAHTRGAAEATVAAAVVKLVVFGGWRADVASTSWARQIKSICAAIRAEAASSPPSASASASDDPPKIKNGSSSSSLVESEEVMRFLGREQREQPPGQHWVSAVHGWIPVLHEWATAHSIAIDANNALKASHPDLYPLYRLLHEAMNIERDLLVRHGASRQVAFDRSNNTDEPSSLFTHAASTPSSNTNEEVPTLGKEEGAVDVSPPPQNGGGGRLHDGENNKAVVGTTERMHRRALRTTAVGFANSVLQCEPPREAYDGYGTVMLDRWPRERCTNPELKVDANEAEQSFVARGSSRRDTQWAEKWGFQYPEAVRHVNSCAEGLQEGEAVEDWWDDLPEKHEPAEAAEFVRRLEMQWE